MGQGISTADVSLRIIRYGYYDIIIIIIISLPTIRNYLFYTVHKRIQERPRVGSAPSAAAAACPVTVSASC